MSVTRDPFFVSNLRSLLLNECTAHEEYVRTLEEEQKAVVKFNQTEVQKLTLQREELATRIQKLADKRKEFLSRFPESESKKLSELLALHCQPDEIKILAPLVKQLRTLIERSQRLSNESNQIVNFSLSFVEGTISILRSATQNITRAYTRRGVVKEYYQTAGGQGLGRA